MASLYELTSDYMELLELAEDPDIDEQAFMDTLDGIEGALEDKAENYAKAIRMLEGDAAACKAEEARLKAKRTTIENNIKRMKTTLQQSMEITGKTKFKTALFSFGIRNNKPSVVIDATDVDDIPLEYLVVDPKPDKTAIYNALKEDPEREDLRGLCHLEASRSLSIR